MTTYKSKIFVSMKKRTNEKRAKRAKMAKRGFWGQKSSIKNLSQKSPQKI